MDKAKKNLEEVFKIINKYEKEYGLEVTKFAPVEEYFKGKTKDSTPHLLDATTSSDDRHVYIIGLDYEFEDLTDYEKKLIYESERYWERNASKIANERLNDLEVLSKYLNKFSCLLPNKVKEIIKKYVD